MRGFFEGFEKRAGWRDKVTSGVRDWVSESGRVGQAVHKGGRAAEAGMGAAADSLKGGKASDFLNKAKGAVNEGRKEYTKALKHNAQTVREGGNFVKNEAGGVIDKGKDFLKKTMDRYQKAGVK